MMKASIEVDIDLGDVAIAISRLETSHVLDFVVELDSFMVDTGFTQELIIRLLDSIVDNEDVYLLEEISRKLKSYGVE